jgi:hypothetical protein
MDRDSAFNRRWLELSSRVARGDWDRLSENDRVFYATNHLRGSVMRGGFQTYFDNAPAHEVRLASAALRQHGAPEIADLVDRAEAILFPQGRGSGESAGSGERQNGPDQQIADDVTLPWEAELEAANHTFYAAARQVDAVVERLAAD